MSQKIHWGGKEEKGNVLRVCTETNQGKREYNEDAVSVVVEDEETRTAFMGVFDGHGGKEAAILACNTLYHNITEQPGFNDENPEKVKDSIRKAFIKTHWAMFDVFETWPKRKDGFNSTSGTTATTAYIRGHMLYISHVGDSAAVMATKENDMFISSDITVDHKPDNVDEMSRIQSLGGRVARKNGVPRVVWRRPARSNGKVVQKQYEYVPFLAVSRSLGDLWSYDARHRDFIVSPEPDIQAIKIIPGHHKFIILASDGLWGVMNGDEAVSAVTSFETTSTDSPDDRNCSESLIRKALDLWQHKRSRADNISVIVIFFDNELAICTQGIGDNKCETDVVVSGNHIPVRQFVFTKAKAAEVNENVEEAEEKEENVANTTHNLKRKNVFDSSESQQRKISYILQRN